MIQFLNDANPADVASTLDSLLARDTDALVVVRTQSGSVYTVHMSLARGDFLVAPGGVLVRGALHFDEARRIVVIDPDTEGLITRSTPVVAIITVTFD